MPSAEYLNSVGSAYALAELQCEEFRLLKKVEVVQRTIQSIRFEMQSSRVFSSEQDFEMEFMFSARLGALEIQMKALEAEINECYVINVPGTTPGSQNTLDGLGYSEFSLESCKKDLCRSSLDD